MWVGGDHRHESYPPEVHQSHPWIDRTCPFRDPLWAVISIDLSGATIDIQGTTSSWVGPDPAACGARAESGFWGWDPSLSKPSISSWRFPLQSQGDIDE